MRTIGFSTGALAYADFRRGLAMAAEARLPAVELSALREPELAPLVSVLDELDLSPFSYVSFHAPSFISPGNERRAVALLAAIRERGWPIVLHPDVVSEPAHWRPVADSLCIENMDKRKATGRTWQELRDWFVEFPNASFCLDLGHARQCDPTMTETFILLRHLGSRLKQLHLSEVTSRSNHECLSRAAILSFREVSSGIPGTIPVIMESPVQGREALHEELQRAAAALSTPAGAVDAERAPWTDVAYSH